MLDSFAFQMNAQQQRANAQLQALQAYGNYGVGIGQPQQLNVAPVSDDWPLLQPDSDRRETLLLLCE